MIDKACRFKFELFDMTNEELTAYIQANSLNDFVAVEYSYRDLGRDEAWLQQMTRELNGDMAKVKREILLEWPRSMDSSVFSEEQIDRIYHFIKQSPVGTIVVNNLYPVDFYEEIDLEKNYIISCDVSGGLSNDNSVILFIDPGTFKPVGIFKSSKIDTDSFKNLIHTLMTFYFRNAILIVESNSYGLNILDTFMKDPAIEPRMYKENREKVGEKTQKDGFTIKRATKTVVYGVATTSASRKLMFDLLMSIVDEEYELITLPDLYKDISMLEKKKNGKIEHADNAHDDVLMAYLIFRYAVFYGKCLRDRFGISPIPSGANIKIRSDGGNGSSRRTDNLLRSVNSDSSGRDALINSPAFQELVLQQQKINQSTKDLTPENVEKNRKMERFKRICSWNE